MTLFYAQPCDRSVEGFFFETIEQFERHMAELTDSFGNRIEEVEIGFVEGGHADFEMFEVWRPDAASLNAYLDAIQNWPIETKQIYIIAVGSGHYAHDEVADDPAAVDVTIYHVFSLRELAEQFVEEGLFGDIPERLQNYIDYDAIARDLHHDGYREFISAGERLIYRID